MQAGEKYFSGHTAVILRLRALPSAQDDKIVRVFGFLDKLRALRISGGPCGILDYVSLGSGSGV